jgi:hypothetical protein
MIPCKYLAKYGYPVLDSGTEGVGVGQSRKWVKRAQVDRDIHVLHQNNIKKEFHQLTHLLSIASLYMGFRFPRASVDSE